MQNNAIYFKKKMFRKKWVKKGKKGFAAHWPRAFLPFFFLPGLCTLGREDNEGKRRYENYPIKREEASTLLVLA